MCVIVTNLFRLLFGRRSLPLNALREVVDGRKLDERREHEGEAEEEEEVEGGRVGDFRDSLTTSDGDRAGCQQRRNSCTRPEQHQDAGFLIKTRHPSQFTVSAQFERWLACRRSV